MKREVLENLQQDFDSRMIIWLANMLGKWVGFERKNSLWIQNAHKTSPMSFYVDVFPLRCLIISKHFVKIGPSGDMNLQGMNVTPLTMFVWSLEGSIVFEVLKKSQIWSTGKTKFWQRVNAWNVSFIISLQDRSLTLANLFNTKF